MAISDTRASELTNLARDSVATGADNTPKGDTLVDMVFSPLDMLTGDRSTHEIAAEEAEFYRDEVARIEGGRR